MKASRLTAVLESLLSQPWATFIWGAPGVGKSSIVRQVAQAKCLPVIDLRASLLDPTDLRGIPMIKDGQSVWCPPSFLPKVSDTPGILFLDEINAAPPLVQAALYQLILDRRVGEYVLPKGWKLIAAGNRREDKAVTFKLSSALANRFIHLSLEVDAGDWHEWAIQHSIDAHIIAFIRMRPELLSQAVDGKEAFATPRSWEMASDVIREFGQPEDTIDILPGIIGEGAAIEFLSFVKNSVALKDLEKIIASPETAALPQALDRLWVVVSYLTTRAKEPQVLHAASVLLSRLPPDFSVVLARDVMKVVPMFARDPGLIAFIQNHGDYFK